MPNETDNPQGENYLTFISHHGGEVSRDLSKSVLVRAKDASLLEPVADVSGEEVKAETVARSLVKFFYAQGCFPAVAKSYPRYQPPLLPASHRGGDEFLQPDLSFGGLAVQAVGYEKGKQENPKVHVYLAKSVKGAEKRLPADIDGVPVAVSRMGKLNVCPGGFGGSNFYQVGGRVACGGSCAPATEQYADTLGALVRIGEDPDVLYCLSNNHVFAACNHTPLGQPIMAPANIEAGPSQAPRHIANHAKIVELHSGVLELLPANRVDVAVAAVVNPDAVTSWQGDAAGGYDTPSTIGEPISGMKVMKLGRSTGLTLGVIDSLSISHVPLPYNCTHFTDRDID